MAEYLNGSTSPPPRGVYQVIILDVPGVVASNNFLSVINPKGSGVLHEALALRIECYSQGLSTTPNSLAGYRTTSQSGGTLYDNTQVQRSSTQFPDPKAQILTGNPTVTKLNSTPFLFKSPPISNGVGQSSGQQTTSPPGIQAFFLEGEGLVFNTAAGNVMQLWDMAYIWAEYAQPVR